MCVYIPTYVHMCSKYINASRERERLKTGHGKENDNVHLSTQALNMTDKRTRRRRGSRVLNCQVYACNVSHRGSNELFSHLTDNPPKCSVCEGEMGFGLLIE